MTLLSVKCLIAKSVSIASSDRQEITSPTPYFVCPQSIPEIVIAKA